MKARVFFILFVIVACSSQAPAVDAAIPWRYDRAPNKPLSPLESVKRMTAPPGFHVELVASEPDITNPIAMAFDDRGRIFITESVEYPRKSAGPGRDRVKLIEGVDADGHATRITTFADGLNIPTGIAYGYGGVWVLNSPDLLFYREKDGKAISKETILTGFGRTDSHELPSSLTWGPDGWLYGLNGVFNQSHVVSKDGKTHDFTCAMWRLHPRTGEFQVFAEGTSNPYGIAWDSEGSAIIEACHWANDHLFHFVETGYYTRQAGAYPPFAMPIGSITDHSHQKTAYCGIAALDTDAFPLQYRGRICVGNIHAGCINMDRLQRDGATYLAKAEPDLLTANDDWSMPVCLKIGPDGSLYVLDWYDRYHCSQDAARDPDGVDRTQGRLYRLRYGQTPRAPQFDLATENDAQLMSRLAGPNGYFRETAQRLLSDRLSDPASNSFALRGALEKMSLDDALPRAQRMHALWSLVGGGALNPSLHEKLLAHADSGFRAWGVRAAGNQRAIAPRLLELVSSLARDASPEVQLQVAIASRKIQGCDALRVITQVLVHCGQDKLIPAIAWSNLQSLLETDGGRFVEELKSSGSQSTGPLAPAVATLMPRIIDRILSAHQPDAGAVADLLESNLKRNPDVAPQCIAAISAKVGSLNDATFATLKQRLAPLIAEAMKADRPAPVKLSAQLLATRLKLDAGDPAVVRNQFISGSNPEAQRLQALETLIAFRDPAVVTSVEQVLQSSSPAFTARVLAALGKIEDPALADMLLRQYPKLPIETQPLAVNLIMQREPWARKLLDAVIAGKLPKGVLNANDLRKIMESDDREAIWAVEKAYGAVRSERNPEREKVVAEMGKYLARNMGDPIAGQRVFNSFCAQCHTIYGQGAKLGPDITANGRSNFDQLLSNVFDPSLVIGAAYQVTTVVTNDGRNLTGLVAEDNDQRIVLKMPGEAEESILRNNVKFTRVSRLSMMPEGIESLLSRKDLSDLFAFLSLDKAPTDPAARPIPGAPQINVGPAKAQEPRIKIEQAEKSLQVRAKVPGADQWADLATFVMDPSLRPHLHPLRDPSGKIVLSEDRPADHPWQHGIFTGFHQVNGVGYWKEDEGHQHFVKLLDQKESADRVSWRALVEFVDPTGKTVLDEEDAITFYAPQSADSYTIDFDLLLRARDQDVKFGKIYVGGLSVRLIWDKANPRQTHLNSEGLRGKECEQKRAEWCNVERPFGNDIFGVVIFDHPSNDPHPPGWRVDEWGLINPNVSSLSDWTIPAHKERVFHYRMIVYKGTAPREKLAAQFAAFAAR